MVVPGLEEIAGEEIAELGGEVKRASPGVVVFRVPEVDDALLHLRTTEDVFLLAWGTDKLTYRAADLEQIRRWTAHHADWPQLLRLHHAIRPKPKGKPTFRLVAQMHGTHGYRRVDARKALARGLEGKLPPSWRHAEENAALEIWLTIHEATAVCGVRLSDRSMRHRHYKEAHLPASLRPTVAAAMVRLSGARAGQVVVDPMCGAGTILAEQLSLAKARRMRLQVLGGDRNAAALRSAEFNLRPLGPTGLVRWDAGQLPLADDSIDCILSNPPFGVQLGDAAEIARLYPRMLHEYDRVLQPEGRAVLLVAEWPILREAAQSRRWKLLRQVRIRVLGQRAVISVWQRPARR
jgi:23S rRNA G2445 N2-methylase RlmL